MMKKTKIKNTVAALIVSAGLLLYLPAEGQSPGRSSSSPAVMTIARVMYEGGGDWYSNPSSLINLLDAIRKYTGLEVDKQEAG